MKTPASHREDDAATPAKKGRVGLGYRVDPLRVVPYHELPECTSTDSAAPMSVPSPGAGPVVYWMSREQRVDDNWALLHAAAVASEREKQLVVMFCLADVSDMQWATWRAYAFMMGGLREVAARLAELGVPFVLRRGPPARSVLQLAEELQADRIVCDISPLRHAKRWRQELAQTLRCPLEVVDGHNVVPFWVTSRKLEYAARTIRPKINSQLPRFLVEMPPPLTPLLCKSAGIVSAVGVQQEPIDWDSIEAEIQKSTRAVAPIDWTKPGYLAGMQAVDMFIQNRLQFYSKSRNNPSNSACLSDLSPYLHYGQISAQRLALMVRAAGHRGLENVQAYLEEVVVRRELSDNFCYYNDKYDLLDGAWDWAKETLRDHYSDKRPYVYTDEQLEFSKTHDDLWNAAQTELVIRGKMHGYLRMYWAKKILEWTQSPDHALSLALRLNDEYSIDGRDPNGVVGCMWAICGVHDQGWGERAIFGKIRYMNYKGCSRKFSIPNYLSYVNQIVLRVKK